MTSVKIISITKRKGESFLKNGKDNKRERLELVNTDVFGSGSMKSLGRNSYVLCNLDWWFKHVDKDLCYWIEVWYGTIFKEWKALVKIEIRMNIKCLKFENGGEYCYGNFEDNCFKNGITRIKTIRKTP